MIIMCKYCKREFDKQIQRQQHEKDAHNNNTPWVEYEMQRSSEKPAKDNDHEPNN